MHREDMAARDLYLHIRELCLWLANDKQQFKIATELTQACLEVFQDLPRAFGQMQEDIEQLTTLQNQQITLKVLEPLRKVCEGARKSRPR